MNQLSVVAPGEKRTGIKESTDYIITILKRKKWPIIIAVFVSTLIATIYSLVTDPVFESTIILKKEDVSNRENYRDDFKNRFSVQSSDELDTELELVQTRTVLTKVIRDINLRFFVKELVYRDGQRIKIDGPLKSYEFYSDENPLKSNLPRITRVQIPNYALEGEFYIEKTHPDKFTFYSSAEGALSLSASDFVLDYISFSLDWPNSSVGDRVYFTLYNIEETLKAAMARIKLSREGKTSIFSFAVRAKTPRLAQYMATTIAEKYREARLEQKRQTIHYSFVFIDSQLDTIARSLKNTELQLSEYKSEHKITILDESSRDLINAISELEAEKVRTELELADNQNQLSQLNKEIDTKGYFDQTFLTPRQSAETRTPFAVLLEQKSDLELRRLELLQRRKETHPEVITVTEQMEKVDAQLADYNKNTMTAYRIIINTLRKKRNNLLSKISDYSDKLETLPSVEARLAELIRDKNVHEKMYNLLMDKREELRVAEYSEIQDIVIIDPATLPIKPVAPQKRLNVALGFFLGLIIASGVAFLQEYFSKRVTTIEDIKKLNMAPILSIIPDFTNQESSRNDNVAGQVPVAADGLIILSDDDTPVKEAYRVLRTKLSKHQLENDNVIMVSSSEEDSGKTTVASNLALSLAHTQKRVLLIDADLRKSGLSRIFDIPADFPGLYHYLCGNGEIPEFWKMNKSKDLSVRDNLFILPAGDLSTEASELLDSPAIKNLIDHARYNFDYVLIDTPPITKVSDTLILGNHCKKMLFVIRPFLTFRDSIPFAIEHTDHANIDILGIVVNGFNLDHATGYYKYGYGYGYGPQKSKEAV